MELSRRTVISTALPAVTSGCGTVPGGGGSDASTPNDSSPPGVSSVSFSARVTDRASADSPATVVVDLGNTGNSAVDLRYGPTLLFTDDAEEYEWADKLVLDPGDEGVLLDEPTLTDDCWRFPADGEVAIQSILETRTLGPGATLTETYDVYTRDGGDCLPAGEYRYQDGVTVGSDATVVLTLTLSVVRDGTISASADVADAPR